MSEKEVLKPGQNIRPIIDTNETISLIKNLYGLTPTSIVELNGYDDKNYKILTNENEVQNKHIKKIAQDGYVFKVMNSFDSKKKLFVEGQNALMLFLHEKGVTCSKLIKNKNNQYYSIQKLQSGEHVVRLLEFIPGTILHQIPLPPNTNVYFQIGQYVAKLDRELENFHHTAYQNHKTLWMLDSVPNLNQFLFAIENAQKKGRVYEIIEQFQARVLSIRNDLEKGVIHGDFNEQNIIMENVEGQWKIKGILDFGDSQYSCYLFELAITITYMVLLGKNLDIAGFVIAGYSTIRKPTKVEFSLLKICVAARLCQSLVMGAYTNLLDPQNSYILTTAAAGWEMLSKLWDEPETQLLNRWKLISEECNY